MSLCNCSSLIVSCSVSTCSKCNESIIDPSKGVVVFGKAFHRDHIKCVITGKDFSDGSNPYEGEDGQVYCQAEWEKRFLKTCTKCKKFINEKKPLIVGDKPFHKVRQNSRE